MQRTVAFWHISNIPPSISQIQICYDTTVFYSSSISEILLYNRQLVVLSYELIYVVRAASHQGTMLLKQNNYLINPISLWGTGIEVLVLKKRLRLFFWIVNKI